MTKAMQVKSIENFTLILKELSPMGLRSWGHLAAYCLDPDGHVLAFAVAAADKHI